MEGETFFKQLKDYLFPIFCVECGSEGEWWCENCINKTEIKPFEIRACGNLETATALFCYTEIDPIARLIRMFKYDFNLDIKKLWRQLIIRSNVKIPKEVLVVPVPLHSKRKRERGYNQSEVLGKILSDEFGLEINAVGLNRTHYTPQQTKLSRDGRMLNVKGAFVWKGESLSGREVLLVDDVFTTGATMQECAKVLTSAGALKVRGFVLAHG